MSYIRAEEVLPKELIETIQQYVNGKAIYIPSTSKKEWGSRTDTRQYLIQRNHEISQKYQGGSSIASLAMQFSLSEKSIQRIVREGKRKSGKLWRKVQVGFLRYNSAEFD